ncbi:MAG: RNA polymerase sigma-70 factor [Bacteroidetes bacterium]|nr:RNA polymerase sigma-70 factor [Bacteroidota bacterium]
MYLSGNFLNEMHLNEQQYWQFIREGDKKVFEQAFKTYYSPLCNYACSILKDMDEAEEVVQNLFYSIWNKRESLQITDSLKSYLYRATHNDCLNKLKHGKVRAMHAEEIKMTTGFHSDDASKDLQGKELAAQINTAIEALPEQCGIVFKLSRFEELKYSEIAAQLNISIKTVENHMGKALKLLRDSLKEYLPFWLLMLFLNC